MSNQRPTMKDVAARAGVALKTVSRVVNGESGVTPATAERVLVAIEELGFRRNESARLLRTGQTATLGFIAEQVADPDQAALYRGLEEVARDQGFLLYSGSTDSEPDREERLALSLCARRVDGLVIVPTAGDHRYLAAEIDAGVATVFALRPPVLAGRDAAPDGAVSGGAALGDVVVADERGGAKIAVAHLIAHGHRRIGYLGAPSFPDTPGALAGYRSRRLALGYTEAMAAAGLPVDERWLSLTPGGLPGAGVTAVFCGSRAHTAQALRALAADHTKRLAVIGFGDFELADLVPPGITVVSYDPARIGRTAGELLMRRLAGDGEPPSLVEVPVALIPRGSAEFPPPD
jgi:LacI family transcriptional regulator, galactose operon repressor